MYVSPLKFSAQISPAKRIQLFKLFNLMTFIDDPRVSSLSLPGLSRTRSAILPNVNLIPVATRSSLLEGKARKELMVFRMFLHPPTQADSDHDSGSQQPTVYLLRSIKEVLTLPLIPSCEHQTSQFQSLNCSILQ